MSDDANTQHTSVDKSVSDILSSYYGINEKHTLGNGKSENLTSNDLLSNLDINFSSPNFDPELHLDDILKKFGISDTLTLLRKLEREIRQLTAGKQILIYDNYECLFSALDTLHYINSELSTVQRHLSNLRSSEIKAASKDITSRHGIRDKLISMSHISGIMNVFSSLASINRFLVASVSHNLDIGLSDTVYKLSPQEVLSVCSKVYKIFYEIRNEQGSEILINFYYDLLKRLIDVNTREIIEKTDGSYTINKLYELCFILSDLQLNKRQVLYFYYKTLAYKIDNFVNDLNLRYKTGSISNSDIFFEVDSILNHIYMNISSPDAAELERRLEIYSENGKFCPFCSSEFDIKFLESEDELIYSYYFLESDTSCDCLTDDIKVQFVFYYSQKAFSGLFPLFLETNTPLATKDVIYGLTFLVDKIGYVETNDLISSLYVDICYKWILFISFFHLQRLFFSLYDEIIEGVFEFLTGSPKDVGTLLSEDLDKLLVEEVNSLFEFVKDLQISLGIHIVTEFHSFLVVYILGIKKIFATIFKEITSIKPDNNRICSITSLLGIRGYADDYKYPFIHELEKGFAVKNTNLADSLDTNLSIEHHIGNKIVKRLETVTGDRKALLVRLILCISSADRLFADVPNLLRANFPGALQIYNTLELTLECKMDSNKSEILTKFRNFVLNKAKNMDFNTPLAYLLPDDSIPFVRMVSIAFEDFKGFPLKSSAKYNESEQMDAFTLENINTFNLANTIISEVMTQYLNRAYSIIKYSLDKLENGHEITGTSVKDFTVLLSEMLEDLNSVTHISSFEQVSVNVEFDNILNFCNTSKDVLNLMGVYRFNLSRDMSLKLFTLHIAQCLNQCRLTYLVEGELFNKLVNGIKQQLLIVFKKTLDVIIMQSLWDKILDSSTHSNT